ncbi:MAG: ATP-binding protein [Oligoflexia bacterium]|nr:ATP-binding protein [Oligoflexia bacterium]
MESSPVRKSRLPRHLKFLAYATTCFVALSPLIFIGFFQQSRFAEENISQLAMHLSTLSRRAGEKSFSPELAVAVTQNHKLVLWTRYLRQGDPVIHTGLPASEKAGPLGEPVSIDPARPIGRQLPPAHLLFSSTPDFVLRLPLAPGDLLEIGVSYRPLYSLARDTLAWSGALFFVAFLFLLGSVLFVDVYVSLVTMRLIRAIRARVAPEKLPEMLGLPHRLSPTFGALMEALESREDQLLDTRDTLEAVFNGLRIGVAMISTEARIVFANQYFRDLVGATTEDWSGRPVTSLSLPGQGRGIQELCERALSSLRFESGEFQLGERHFVQEAYPLFDSDRTPVALMLQCRDVTLERAAHRTMRNFNDELQRQLQEQRQKLLHSARLAAVGELAGAVAHEINNPNGVILAGARYALGRLQAEPEAPDYLGKYLQRIVKQSERVATIVSALLTFSRRLPQPKEPLHIREPLEDALELATIRLKRQGIELIEQIGPELPLIEGSRSQLTQVLVNFINNAVDALPEGGRVWISASSRDTPLGAGLRLSVRDDGPGIPPELLSKVTEPFFTTKPVGKGTGLGLSVSHGILEEHGATLRISNHPEGGAEFEVLFPPNGGSCRRCP